MDFYGDFHPGQDIPHYEKIEYKHGQFLFHHPPQSILYFKNYKLSNKQAKRKNKKNLSSPYRPSAELKGVEMFGSDKQGEI